MQATGRPDSRTRPREPRSGWAKWLAMGGVWILSLGSGVAADWMAPELRPLFSRLQAMSHGLHTDAEWDDLASDIGDRIDQARGRSEIEQMIDAAVLLSQVKSEMRGAHAEAIAVLEETQAAADPFAPEGMYKLYVRLAEVYSRLGDEAAIDRLIDAFRNSRYYNPRSIATSGGEEPGVAFRIPRPQAKGDPSLTVTMMQHYARQARLAPGKRFPVIPAEGRDPNLRLLDPTHAKLLLVDFWLPGWTAWERDLPQLSRLARRYRDAGLAVVGVPLTKVDPATMERLRAQGMTWPQIGLEGLDLRRFGVAGEVANFLVSQQGVILARDIHGHQLEEVVRAALRP